MILLLCYGLLSTTMEVDMDCNELLLAAKVREIAMQIRQFEWLTEADRLDYVGKQVSNPALATHLFDEWHASRPLTGYVPRAFAIVRDMALQIRSINLD